MDDYIVGRIFECDAAKLTKVTLLCMYEFPFERPSMEVIVKEFSSCTSCL